MATSLEQIAQFLTNRGWKFELDAAHSRIVTGVNAENVEQFFIAVSLQENGEYFELLVPQLLNIKDHVYKGVLFQTLLATCFESKMLRWQYDPRDGEVRASIAVALEDAVLTERQFNRMLSGLIDLVDRVAMPRLKAVMEMGEDPGRVGEAQRMAEMLRALPPEHLAQLQQAMAQLRQSENA